MQESEAVSQYIFRQENFQNELFYVRKIISKNLSDIEESIKWGIPFYNYKEKPLLYLHPKEQLIIGFMDGMHLEDEDNLFAMKSFSLKRIRHVYFPIVNEENIEKLTDEELELLNETSEEFEERFCKMLKKAADFIENKRMK
ncbi:DUF1801 domain-containing protein [Bernardetia sp.]|uniref:DUF1801 domain-containing protein n=1 Tax=Bernardetia sp. TaxID=1937974 RepID=UPI0025C078D2|nr:DUF1801 domain-containing protein [Bernardetia sp.]